MWNIQVLQPKQNQLKMEIIKKSNWSKAYLFYNYEPNKNIAINFKLNKCS